MELDDIWQIRDFELPAPGPNFCVFARQFNDWVGKVCTDAVRDPTDIGINQAKVLLVDRYFEWYSAVPQAHKNHLGTRDSHTCIFQVFLNAYTTLKAAELSITHPPRFFEPPSPPTQVHVKKVVQPQIAGLAIGEEVEEMERLDGEELGELLDEIAELEQVGLDEDE